MKIRNSAARIALAVLVAIALCCTSSSAATTTTESWCPALAAGNPIFDGLGDSLTESGSVDVPQRWTSLINSALHSDGAPNAQVWTGGAIGGSATADYIAGARYANHIEFTVHQPDVITLGWGTNDWVGDVPVAQFRAQYQQIIDRIRVLAPRATIVIIHMPWVYNASLTSIHGSQTPYRDAERDLAAVNGLHYLAEEWPFAGNDPLGLDMPDRVHKNAAGQNVQFALTWAFLRGLCG